MSSAFVKKAEDISSSFLRVLFALNVFFQTSDLFITRLALEMVDLPLSLILRRPDQYTIAIRTDIHTHRFNKVVKIFIVGQSIIGKEVG